MLGVYRNKSFLELCDRLEAEMTSVPVSRVAWYVNGIELQPTDRTRMVQEGRTIILIITNAGLQDSGEYTLRVQNDLGEVTCRTTLVIEGM